MDESSKCQKSWTFEMQILKHVICLQSINYFKFKKSIDPRWTENTSEKLSKSS